MVWWTTELFSVIHDRCLSFYESQPNTHLRVLGRWSGIFYCFKPLFFHFPLSLIISEASSSLFVHNFIKKAHQIVLCNDIHKIHLKEKNKHLALQFTKHFFSVPCGHRCMRRKNMGFARWIDTDLLRHCSAGHCSWLRSLPLLWRCRYKKPWTGCLMRNEFDLVFSVRSNGQCEGQLEREKCREH